MRPLPSSPPAATQRRQSSAQSRSLASFSFQSDYVIRRRQHWLKRQSSHTADHFQRLGVSSLCYRRCFDIWILSRHLRTNRHTHSHSIRFDTLFTSKFPMSVTWSVCSFSLIFDSLFYINNATWSNRLANSILIPHVTRAMNYLRKCKAHE